jgi:hypothetical protein
MRRALSVATAAPVDFGQINGVVSNRVQYHGLRCTREASAAGVSRAYS